MFGFFIVYFSFKITLVVIGTGNLYVDVLASRRQKTAEVIEFLFLIINEFLNFWFIIHM